MTWSLFSYQFYMPVETFLIFGLHERWLWGEQMTILWYILLRANASFFNTVMVFVS